jgi:hypothetical protein
MGEPAAVPSSSPSPRLDLVFAGQASLAVALPWAAGRLLSSDQAIWAVVLLLGVGAFAWVERSKRLVWLLPVSALASLLPVLMPQIPSAWGIPSGLIALVVAVVVAAVGTRRPAPASPSRRRQGWWAGRSSRPAPHGCAGDRRRPVGRLLVRAGAGAGSDRVGGRVLGRSPGGLRGGGRGPG